MIAALLIAFYLQQPPDLFRIVEATRQEWTGGIEASGRGVNYEIKLVAGKGSAKLKFVSLTVEQQGCFYKISNISDPEKGNRYHKGDTLMITAMLKDPVRKPAQKEKPYPVLGYTYRKELYYFPIRQGMSFTRQNHP